MTTALSLSVNNLTAWPTYLSALDAAAPGAAFFEVLWDNYAHLPPEALGRLREQRPWALSLHVMYSGFLSRPADRARAFFERIGRVVRAARPARVSDHLLSFAQNDGLNLLTPLEHPYSDLATACDRVDAYQQAIGMQLLVENFASQEGEGLRQLDFLDALRARTGCGILFDVSNAVVAELNGAAPADAWLPLLRGAVHAHVGGFSFAPKTGRYLDTHDADLAERTIALLRSVRDQASLSSVCLERERAVSEAALLASLQRLALALGEADRAAA